jgi:hypothetical protein
MTMRHETLESARPSSADAHLPHIGDLLLLTEAASVQFRRPIRFRVIRRLPWTTYIGWCWVRGYELGETGEAIDERDVFVQLRGLRYILEPQP